MQIVEVHHVECVEQMRRMLPECVDSVVCDPPYGIGFMGKDFDTLGGGNAQQAWHERWLVEAYRVLKPGGHLVAFGGSRTFHRLFSAAEDVGFDIRDSLMWLYGSGFPKSHNVAIAIDKAAGAMGHRGKAIIVAGDGGQQANLANPKGAGRHAPSTPEAQAWDGWGTALKPAHEPILLARKPFKGTVARNVLAHGTGALNIDASRITTSDDLNGGAYSGGARPSGLPGDDAKRNAGVFHPGAGRLEPDAYRPPTGRWPANVLLSHAPDCERQGTAKIKGITGGNSPGSTGRLGGNDTGIYSGGSGYDAKRYGSVQAPTVDADGMETIERWSCAPGCPVAALDEQSGPSKSGGGDVSGRTALGQGSGWNAHNNRPMPTKRPTDSGGASRFFYSAKASRKERERGCEHLAEKRGRKRGNHHPTVKPIGLMEYLIKLVTRSGGIVLDPFAGSGTCGVAAARAGCSYVGLEQDAEYVEIAQARIQATCDDLAIPTTTTSREDTSDA